MGRLARKTALVTGGSRGIGRAIVDRFLAEGARVLTCGRSDRPDDLDDAALWVRADMAVAADVDALRHKVTEMGDHLDILVNNAGVQVEKTVVESSDDDWDLVMGANAKGVFMACRAMIPLMQKKGDQSGGSSGSSIVNIGSISGNHADPSMALYNGSKAFVHGLTRSIAVDHGAEGIRCNAVCPGWIMTGMADAAFDLAQDPVAAKKDAIARHAAGRFGAPDDIASAVLFLASDDAAFVTGQTFTVDGGLVAASPLQPGLF